MPDEPDDILTHYHDAEHAAAIMRAISTWARFELEVDSLIWRLAGLDEEQGACLTAQFPGAAARMNALIALARVQKVKAKHINALNGLMDTMRAPQDKRNRLVHDPWFYGMETKKHYRLEITARSVLKRAYKPVSEDDVKDHLREFVALVRRFQEVRSAILADWQPPS